MKKKFLSVILTIGLITSIVGCGVNEEEKNAVNAEAESAQTQKVENEVDDIEEIEETASENKADVESTDNEEEYEEQEDIFVCRNIDVGDGTLIDLTDREIIHGPFILTESIDIYSNYLTYAGYTKPDIKIGGVGKVNEEWLTVAFAQSGFLVKADDFDRVAVLEEREEDDSSESYLESVMESMPRPGGGSATPAQTESDTSSGNEAPSTSVASPQTEAPAPATTTYSEAEVISIVESALRDAGCRKPEEDMTAEELAMFGPTAGMGWGIENIPMNDPYMAASKIVEGFQFAGWNFYYIENQGSSDGYVHLKLYSGS